jgi:hypothetical protein
MVEKYNALLDAIALLIFEQSIKSDFDSDDVIKKVLRIIDESKTSKMLVSKDTITEELIKYINNMLADKADGIKFNYKDIARDISTIMLIGLKNSDIEYEDFVSSDIQDTLRPPPTYDECVEAIRIIRKRLINIANEQEIKNISKKFYGMVNSGSIRSKVMNIASEIRLALEKLEANSSTTDDAVNSEISLGGDNVDESIKKLTETLIERRVYKLGWQHLNKAFRGGIRSGECLVIGALSHNYKTGTTLSALASLCLYNEWKDEGKGQPLILHFTFEDKPDSIIVFLYKLINRSFYNNELDNTIPLIDMARFVNKELTKNGAKLEIIDVNPTLWSYKKLLNKIEQYIAKGYDVRAVITDYLEKLPTIGCDKSAGTGSDKKDLLRRVRNFMNSRDIAYITPWQLNSGANELLRNGLPPAQFLKEVTSRSYYYGSNTLNTDIDLELMVHKVVLNNKSYLSLMRGKHRLPGTIPEDDKFFILEFPDDGPIPLDTHLPEPTGFKSFSEVESGSSNGMGLGF